MTTKRLLATLLLPMLAAAPFVLYTAKAAQKPCAVKPNYRTEVSISQGYRRDRLVTTSRGPHGHPNIFDEIRARHVKIWDSRVVAKTYYNATWLRLQAGYGVVNHGRSKETQWLHDHEDVEFYKVRSHVHGGQTVDIDLALGRDFFPTQKTTLAPLVGYGWNVERYRFNHATRETDVDVHTAKIHHPHHRYHGYHNKYKARWNAPFVGVRAQHDTFRCCSFFFEYDFSFLLKFHGTAYRHHLKRLGVVRGQTQDRSRRENGFGHNFVVGARSGMWHNLSLECDYQLRKFYAKKGHQSIPISHHHTERHPFRKANLTSSEIRLQLNYLF